MEFIKTNFDGIIIIKPSIYKDNRGCFFESYNYDEFSKNGIETNFLQDNQSMSNKGVLRGLHFQNPPFQQKKLVRVIQGSVLDVAVDIRKKSKDYGKYFSYILNSQKNEMLLLPEGFAHGFLSLCDETIFQYKCSNIYNKDSECSLLWNDKDLDINWNFDNPIISEKDRLANTFADFNSQF